MGVDQLDLLVLRHREGNRSGAPEQRVLVAERSCRRKPGKKPWRAFEQRRNDLDELRR